MREEEKRNIHSHQKNPCNKWIFGGLRAGKTNCRWFEGNFFLLQWRRSSSRCHVCTTQREVVATHGVTAGWKWWPALAGNESDIKLYLDYRGNRIFAWISTPGHSEGGFLISVQGSHFSQDWELEEFRDKQVFGCIFFSAGSQFGAEAQKVIEEKNPTILWICFKPRHPWKILECSQRLEIRKK